MTKKLRFLIASGPTQEPLDPVRYISNYSTGTMGKYLVQAAKNQGNRVTWVECPKKAETALELERELKKLLPSHDVLVMVAAVCDVRPVRFSRAKIKKDLLSAIKVTKNPDILKNLSKIKKSGQVFIGFGLESDNLLKNGLKKLRQKSLDLIVLQRVTKNAHPFGDKPIDAFLLGKDEGIARLGTITKQKLARLIIDRAEELVKVKRRDEREPFC